MAGARPPEKQGFSKSAVLGLVFALLLLALILYASAGLRRHTCEVCITYNGETACRKADGRSREEARRTATDTACAALAAGMTESLRCTNTPPQSERCDGEYSGNASGREEGP